MGLTRLHIVVHKDPTTGHNLVVVIIVAIIIVIVLIVIITIIPIAISVTRELSIHEELLTTTEHEILINQRTSSR